jgi:hypothetical protein
MKNKLRTAASFLALSVAGVLAPLGVAEATAIATYEVVMTSPAVVSATVSGTYGGLFKGNITKTIAGDNYFFAPNIPPNSSAMPDYSTTNPDFWGWCIQPTETFNWNTNYQYDLVKLSDAPVLAPGSTMGNTNANWMRLLFGTLLGTATADFDGPVSTAFDNNIAGLTDQDRYNAFQLAVWEISYERSGALSIGLGSFTKTSADSNENALATYWLGQIAAGAWTKKDDSLFALIDHDITAPWQQDFIVKIAGQPPQEVPLPAAAWLFGSALVGTFTIARRRRKSVAA